MKELSAKDKKLKARIEKSLKTFDMAFFVTGRPLFKLIPGDPRCESCMAPFEGRGGSFVDKVFNKRRSMLNPLMCNTCEDLVKRLRYGTELEMSMLFADIRGSTPLAESMSPTEFKDLIGRFYNESIHVLVHSRALVDKLVGDEVRGYYVPGFAGKHFALHAIEAAIELLQATGHADPDGPWAPLGIGINTGTAYFGAVNSTDGLVELTALGDEVNVAARLASHAAAGEIIISDSTARSAGIETHKLEKRTLDLKGKSKPMHVWVMRTPQA